MPRGRDPYLFHDEKNGIIELGHQDWYEDPGYQMSHNDWCNVIKQYELKYVDFLEFWYSEKSKPWKDEINSKFSTKCDIAQPWIEKSLTLEEIKKDILDILPSEAQSWDKKYKSKLTKILSKTLSSIDKPINIIWK